VLVYKEDGVAAFCRVGNLETELGDLYDCDWRLECIIQAAGLLVGKVLKVQVVVGVDMRKHGDTHAEPERVQIALMRAAPPWRKLALLGQLNATVKALALEGLRRRHPQASESALRRLLAEQLLGEALAARVYGALPGKEPEHV